MATRRQDIIATASRDAVVGKWGGCTRAQLIDWLATSGAAACVARDHGTTRDDLVDGMDFDRLVSAVNRSAVSERKRMDWMSALRGGM